MSPKLELQDVTITYPGSKNKPPYTAVANIHFKVLPGEFICVVGPSGCGKTTILNAIAGLVAPTKGKVLIDGQISDKPGRNRSVVFQQASLFPWRTALQNVAYGLELNHVKKADALEKAKQLLELVGLSKFGHHYPSQLSGGMQQRVNLARALATEPDILLLDEPFGALDAQTREFMQIELLRIWQETRKTALLITHDIGEAVFLADRVIVLSAGPGQVKEIVPIEIPRPRDLKIKHSAAFHDYERQIWELIASEYAKIGGAFGAG
jgi:NitT/TauT family transport system ATP-binding protein